VGIAQDKAPCSFLNEKELEIHKEVSMKAYETAFLIAPNLPEEDNEKLIDKMADIVSKKKGKMVNIDKWGKRKLAYPIHKHEEAFYVFFLYEGEPAIPAELERRFKQTEAVLRFLTVRTEVKAPVKKKGRAAPKRKKKDATAKEEALPAEDTPRLKTAPKEDDTDASIPEATDRKEEAPDKTPPEVSDKPVEDPQEEPVAEEETKEEA